MHTDRRKSIRPYASAAPVSRRLLHGMSRSLLLLVLLSVCFSVVVSTQPATNAQTQANANAGATQTSTTSDPAAPPASTSTSSSSPPSSSSTPTPSSPSSTTGSSSSPASASATTSEAPQDPLAADIAAAMKRQADDTREMKYVIGLLRSMPTLPSTPGEGARTLVMTSKNGSKFKCTIPHPSASSNLLAPPPEEVPAAVGGVKAGTTVTGGPADSKQGKSAADASATTNSADPYGAAAAATSTSMPAASKSSSTPAAAAASEAVAAVDPETARKNQLAFERKHIPLQVRKILGDGCFTRQIDFWTYEVCPFKRIRQYHRKPDTQTISMEFGLGSHTPLADTVEHFPEGSRPSAHALHSSAPTTPSQQAQAQAQYQKLLTEINSSGFPEVSYTQTFEGGTNNRQSSVTFRCNLDPSPVANTMHLLIGVREPKPHHYEFEIRTKLLCRDADGRLPALDSFLPGGGKSAAAAAAAASGKNAAAPAPAGSSQPAAGGAGGPNAKNPTAQQQAALNSGPVETGRLKSGPHRFSAQKDAIPNVLDLLEPMGQECMYLNTGWWTYKFCYLKEITQFHREQVQVSLATASLKAQTPIPTPGGANAAPAGGAAAGAAGANVKTGAKSAAEAAANLAAAGLTIQTKLVTTAEFTLGQLQPDLSVEHLEKQAQIVKGDSWETTYVSQHYYDGTVCDLNNRPRISETRIYCDLHESASVLKSVVESATCEYIIIIHTPTICPHPLFKPDVPKVVEITCEPISLSTNQPTAIKLN